MIQWIGLQQFYKNKLIRTTFMGGSRIDLKGKENNNHHNCILNQHDLRLKKIKIIIIIMLKFMKHLIFQFSQDSN